MDVVIIIPAYNPDEKFIHFLKDIRTAGYDKIIVIDDGSKLDTKHFSKPLRKNSVVSFYPTALILGKVEHIKQDLIFTYLNRKLFIQKPSD